MILISRFKLIEAHKFLQSGNKQKVVSEYLAVLNCIIQLSKNEVELVLPNIWEIVLINILRIGLETVINEIDEIDQLEQINNSLLRLKSQKMNLLETHYLSEAFVDNRHDCSYYRFIGTTPFCIDDKLFWHSKVLVSDVWKSKRHDKMYWTEKNEDYKILKKAFDSNNPELVEKFRNRYVDNKFLYYKTRFDQYTSFAFGYYLSAIVLYERFYPQHPTTLVWFFDRYYDSELFIDSLISLVNLKLDFLKGNISSNEEINEYLENFTQNQTTDPFNNFSPIKFFISDEYIVLYSKKAEPIAFDKKEELKFNDHCFTLYLN